MKFLDTALRLLGIRQADTLDPAGADHLLWSKGYARHCDFGGPPGYWAAGTETLQSADRMRAAYDGAHGLVWVRMGTGRRDGKMSDLDLFAENALPTIRQPFILLTSDGDISVPSEVEPRTLELLLGSPWLVAWYTQNHDGANSDRIRPLPIGLDLHTPDSYPSPGMRADAMAAIAAERLPPNRQPLKVFCDIAVSLASQDRLIAKGRLMGCPHVVMQTERIPRHEIWRRYAEHPFVVSARGNGLDCHRTWEALYLGSIVITPKSSLDPLFRDLPVVTVDAWGEILSTDNLKRWVDRYSDMADRKRIERLLDIRSRLAEIRKELPAG